MTATPDMFEMDLRFGGGGGGARWRGCHHAGLLLIPASTFSLFSAVLVFQAISLVPVDVGTFLLLTYM